MGEIEGFKQCSHCGCCKPLDGFAWRSKAKGRRAPFCRTCQAEYMREHYLANKALYIERAGKSNRRIRLDRTRRLLAFLHEHPCADCGETDPIVLEFDHLRDKAFNVGEGLTARKWEAVEAEMEKCEVVCANCHRRRTAQRRRTTKLHLMGEAGDGLGRGSRLD